MFSLFQRNNSNDESDGSAPTKQPSVHHCMSEDWVIPSTNDNSFIPYLGKTFVSEEYPVDDAYVFGKGSLGIGLYSLETKDSYEILHQRLTAEEAKQGRVYRLEKEETQKILQQFTSTLQMLAFVEYKLSSPGPYAAVDKHEMEKRLRYYANRNNVWDSAILTKPTAFSYSNPEFPFQLTNYRRGKLQGIGQMRVNPTQQVVNQLW